MIDSAAEMAYRMGEGRKDPMAIRPYDPNPPIREERDWGESHCGHYEDRFDVDLNKRIVTCRHCEAKLDPYDVLGKLARMVSRESMRLKAAQELEEREAKREGERRARAAVRRHRYAPYAYKNSQVYCATCGGWEAEKIHTGGAAP